MAGDGPEGHAVQLSRALLVPPVSNADIGSIFTEPAADPLEARLFADFGGRVDIADVEEPGKSVD